MKAKYESKFIKMNPYGFGPYLYIDKDPQVRSLNFVAELGVTDLCMNSCPHARKIPRTLKQLQHYNSDLKTLKFAEGAVNLEVLYAHNGNMIGNANGLRALRNLKFLELRYNKMVDQSPVEYLTAKGCLETCFIGEQTQPSQQEIDEARLW
ncbi:Leucine-rich_repeat domain superfamily [Hexamita inflata]|uniref:Leucine-rich repeat domain superfamily n=1 Tax=Hexamita inflata TaxID=28002 RepID=A0AA86RL12_9EUKA|nr:Leucine-rich repeat domain superfamily [Hexamita inflata]